MVHKDTLKLLILFLGFILLISAAAVPTSRSLLSNKEDSTVDLQTSLVQGALDLRNGEDMFDLREEFIEGRMDLESTDYPGTGANNHHDPKSPGRA
ncbi:putative Transmembrane protein [Quillaja saponaria]|uniref:Transmembrane protein n=1 Tax=Quillaja saponaria TaxID=32244 RepID=A0AAD7VDS8_QUISA|nr:putative Transmembrane protein [Quillaja saponaria]